MNYLILTSSCCLIFRPIGQSKWKWYDRRFGQAPSSLLTETMTFRANNLLEKVFIFSSLSTSSGQIYFIFPTHWSTLHGSFQLFVDQRRPRIETVKFFTSLHFLLPLFFATILHFWIQMFSLLNSKSWKIGHLSVFNKILGNIFPSCPVQLTAM